MTKLHVALPFSMFKIIFYDFDFRIFNFEILNFAFIFEICILKNTDFGKCVFVILLTQT